MSTIWSFVRKQQIIVATVISMGMGVGFGTILRQYTVQPWTEREIMYLKFPGELFIRLVNCLILPLVTSSIVSATIDLRKSGFIGLMALCYYTLTTILGITLSVILVETIRPGEFYQNKTTLDEGLQKNFMTIDTFLDLFRNLIPENIVTAYMYQTQTLLLKPENETEVPIENWPITYKDMPGSNVLGLVFSSLILGLAIGGINENGKPLVGFFNSLSKVTMAMMNWVIITAPVAAFFLISARIQEVENFQLILAQLGAYLLTVFIGLVIHGYIVLPLLYFAVTLQSPYKIILKLGPALATACGTSSSTATVPVTIKCLKRIGINSKVIKFIVPIGAAINMDGIALYETIGAIFIIQLRGLEFSLSQVIVISITCTVSCIGAAGIPSGGYMMLIMVLNSVGAPVEDVSLIIAVDCFVDRFRTTINIIADALGSSLISYLIKDTEMNGQLEEQQRLRPLASAIELVENDN